MVAPTPTAPMSKACFDAGEQDLVVRVRIGQELVVVELQDEGNLVGVLARHDAQHAERRGDGVAAALDRQLHDVLGIEVHRVGRERRAGRVLDALVDGQDRDVAGAAQAAVIEQRLQARSTRVGRSDDRWSAVDEVGPRQVEALFGNGLAAVLEQGDRVCSQDLFDGSHAPILLLSRRAPVVDGAPRSAGIGPGPNGGTIRLGLRWSQPRAAPCRSAPAVRGNSRGDGQCRRHARAREGTDRAIVDGDDTLAGMPIRMTASFVARIASRSPAFSTRYATCSPSAVAAIQHASVAWRSIRSPSTAVGRRRAGWSAAAAGVPRRPAGARCVRRRRRCRSRSEAAVRESDGGAAVLRHAR